MGNTFGPKGIIQRLQDARFQIEISQIIIHKADQPDVLMHFFNADGLAGEDLAEIDFFSSEADTAATGDHDGLVVERIIDIRQSGVGTRRRSIDLRWALHVQGFVRSYVVENFDEVIESGLLSKKVSLRRLGGLFFQREMHALVASILLRVPWLDPLDADSQPEPPYRELAQVKQSMGRGKRNPVVAADVRRQAAFAKSPSNVIKAKSSRVEKSASEQRK